MRAPAVPCRRCPAKYPIRFAAKTAILCCLSIRHKSSLSGFESIGSGTKSNICCQRLQSHSRAAKSDPPGIAAPSSVLERRSACPVLLRCQQPTELQERGETPRCLRKIAVPNEHGPTTETLELATGKRPVA